MCNELLKKNSKLEQELFSAVKEGCDFEERAEALRRYSSFLYSRIVTLTISAHTFSKKTTRFQKNMEQLMAEQKLHYEAEIKNLKHQLGESCNSEEMEKIKEESEKWKQMYSELLAKVEPFMEQIENYELEKQALLGQRMSTQADLEKLSKDYVKLLGHQNQKQKIHHINKLKEEKFNLQKVP
ncbi:hypothetical protein ACJMK2_033160 [Sinanodonta woodiana]|uniref:Hyaluronan-mediated motility receptor C-terminal domain-containing protein n=1 Tax=Sinanodonta woodiana TaxID=1069815 RepID=A0ABD3X7I1_SINWO